MRPRRFSRGGCFVFFRLCGGYSRVINPHRKTHSLRRTQPLHPDPVLAAHLQPCVAVRGCHRRADAVGPGRAGGDGLRRRRRSAAAGWPLHPARRAVGVRAARNLAPPRGPGHLGDGRAAGLVGDGGAGHHGRWSTKARPRPGALPGVRLGVCPGRRRRLSPGRRGAPRLHHAVPVEARDGRIRHRPGALRRGRPAQQAVRRAEGRGQHGRKADRHRARAAAGELDHLCRRRQRARRCCSCCRAGTKRFRPGWSCSLATSR